MKMLYTGKQAIESVEEIMQITEWTLNKVASQAVVHKDALRRLMNGEIKTPQQSTLDRIEKLLIKVRKIK